MVHVISVLDDGNAPRRHCGTRTSITGFTEWAAASMPATSVGFSWKLEIHGQQVECVRVSLPHTNIMVVDKWDQDYCWMASLNTLATIVDAMPWSEETCGTVIRHYRWRS